MRRRRKNPEVPFELLKPTVLTFWQYLSDELAAELYDSDGTDEEEAAFRVAWDYLTAEYGEIPLATPQVGWMVVVQDWKALRRGSRIRSVDETDVPTSVTDALREIIDLSVVYKLRSEATIAQDAATLAIADYGPLDDPIFGVNPFVAFEPRLDITAVEAPQFGFCFSPGGFHGTRRNAVNIANDPAIGRYSDHKPFILNIAGMLILSWVSGDGLDEALEESARWASEFAPGLLMPADEIVELITETAAEYGYGTFEAWQEALQNGEEDAERAEQEALADLTSTESGYIDGYEWTIAFDPFRRDFLEYMREAMK